MCFHGEKRGMDWDKSFGIVDAGIVFSKSSFSNSFPERNIGFYAGACERWQQVFDSADKSK